jgi:uncharacterized membrane protein
MPFCGTCGAKVDDNVKFCPSCGAAMSVAPTAPVTEVPVQEPVQQVVQEPVQQPVQQAAPVYQNQQQGQQNQYQQQGQSQQQGQGQQTNQNFFDKLMDTPDTTKDYDPKDMEENKVMALLSYIGVLFLVPLLAAPNSKFSRYHANQGIILFIGEAAGSIVLSILSFIMAFISGILAGIVSFIIFLFGIVCLAFAIFGIMNVVNGKAKELPFIGKIRILK